MERFSKLVEYINRKTSIQMNSISSSTCYWAEFIDSIRETIEQDRVYHLNKIQALAAVKQDLDSVLYHVSWQKAKDNKRVCQVVLLDSCWNVISTAASSNHKEMLAGQAYSQEQKEEIEKIVLCRALNNCKPLLKLAYLAFNNQLKIHPELMADMMDCTEALEISFPYEAKTFHPDNVFELLDLIEDYQQACITIRPSA